MLDCLFDGTADAIWRLPDGTFVPLHDYQLAQGRFALLPGSFNPLHAGHTALREVATQLTSSEVFFELAVSNVDKPPLTRDQIALRLKQTSEPVLLTNQPTFLGKAKLIGPTTFVVGIDTAERIVDRRYYSESLSQLTAALDALRAIGCRFLVAGRLVGGRFHTIADVAMPDEYSDLFHAIPEDVFRSDLSSTAIRDGRQ